MASVKVDTRAFPCRGCRFDKGAKDGTCANRAAYVPTCHCVYMKVCAHDFWPQCDKKSVRMCNRTEVNMNATKGENERELENEKRGRRQRCSKSAVCTNVGMKRHTLIGTCLEIHTHTHIHSTLTQKPHTHRFHFCLVWQHS